MKEPTNRIRRVLASIMITIVAGTALMGPAQADTGETRPLGMPMLVVAHCARGDNIALDWTAAQAENAGSAVRYTVYRAADGGEPEPIHKTRKTSYTDRQAAQDSSVTTWTYTVIAHLSDSTRASSTPALVTFLGTSCVWVYPGLPPEVGTDLGECVPDL